jgi:hypothetical protein
MPTYESHSTGGVYVSDDLGEHHFDTEEEYKEYRNKRWDAVPIICNNCIYHLQENKKKFKCPLDRRRSEENMREFGQCEGNCKACSYYWKNPETTKDWYKWYKNGFLSRYWYYRRTVERKLRIGFYRSYRKFFFYWPSIKYPYFEFVHRTRNEFEDECNVYNIGWISKEHSYDKKKSRFFEKFYYTQYHFSNEHINYEYALCTSDYYVDTFNNVKSNDCHFKCHSGEIYQVRPVRKYKYYDILYNRRDEDEYELKLKGQLTEDEFNKHFRIPEHEELMTLLQERRDKREKENAEKTKTDNTGEQTETQDVCS